MVQDKRKTAVTSGEESNHSSAVSDVSARTTTDPAPPLDPEEQRDLIPAYFYPDLEPPRGTESQWRLMVRVAHPNSIAIMNPDSGPGLESDPNYVKAAKYCESKHQKLIGYLSTLRGRAPSDAVIRNIRNYRLWYPEISGFFLDEMNNNANDEAVESSDFEATIPVSSYYGKLRDEIRALPNQTIVGNPGNVSEEQADWAFDVVDILVVHENFGKDYLNWSQPKWAYPGTDRAHAYRIAHLVHGVQSDVSPEAPESQEHKVLETSRSWHAGYVYVTEEVEFTRPDGTQDPLWNKLPNSWSQRAPIVPD